MEIIAGLGGIISLLMVALAIITPLMIYLIQRNTYQTRQEIRKLNQHISNLTDQIKKQQTPPPAKPEYLHTTCPNCKNPIKYSSQHRGKKKTCPICDSMVLLK